MSIIPNHRWPPNLRAAQIGRIEGRDTAFEIQSIHSGHVMRRMKELEERVARLEAIVSQLVVEELGD